MIYVFKTSVQTKSQAKKLKPYIDSILQEGSWNFDLQDRDKVLRIESEENIILPITNVLHFHNFDCKELE